jgi:hypothetical protein
MQKEIVLDEKKSNENTKSKDSAWRRRRSLFRLARRGQAYLCKKNGLI